METILDFFNYIWSNTPGLARIFILNRRTREHEVRYFNWPSQADNIVRYCQEKTGQFEVYYNPVLFSVQKGTKDAVLGSNVLWIDLDDGIPEDWPRSEVPEPSLKIQSSDPNKQHWYWKLDRILPGDEVEKLNRRLAYYFRADFGGWDMVQLLRPPQTLNYKRMKPVTILESTKQTFAPGIFNIPEPPPLPIILPVGDLPDLTATVAKYSFSENLFKLLVEGDPRPNKRSDGLMRLAYDLAELGMTVNEMMVLLLDADERWGKFKSRENRIEIFQHIISLAKHKYPDVSTETLYDGLGFNSLLKKEIEISWVLENFLHDRGYVLTTGEAGVGKSQFALFAGQSIALGKDVLHFKCTKKKKIGFFSYEMGIEELKLFAEAQATGYNQQELEELEKSFITFPLGESIDFGLAREREKFEAIIADLELEGVIIDSLSSVIDGDLSQEQAVKPVMNWIDRVRKKTGKFIWVIHHHVKGGNENKPSALKHVYGSRYITRNASSVVCMWPTPYDNRIEMSAIKMRLAKKFKSFTIERTDQLHFRVPKIEQVRIERDRKLSL